MICSDQEYWILDFSSGEELSVKIMATRAWACWQFGANQGETKTENFDKSFFLSCPSQRPLKFRSTGSALIRISSYTESYGHLSQSRRSKRSRQRGYNPRSLAEHKLRDLGFGPYPVWAEQI